MSKSAHPGADVEPTANVAAPGDRHREQASRALRVIPLGGLGEVGMNCLALEQDDGLMIVDCGVTFPEDDRGIDVLYPSFEYLESRVNKLCGVFLTHGHEDHIGALPYLLSRFPVPVWGPAHALTMARRRVRERLPEGSVGPLDFREVKPGSEVAVGPFVVEPIRVAHSIVEATALKIETAAGTVLHTGDFNFDPDPADGEPTDEKRLEEIGRAGVDLLLSDSTNVEGRTPASSERQVESALDELVSEARGRVVVGLFSSNVQRLIGLGRIARKTGRRIGLLGRSLKTHVETAVDLGHLAWNSEHCVAPEDLSRCASRELLLLAGGTQAEPGSALDRLSQDTHPALSLDAGDCVILSSRVIPGNDRQVSRMMDGLLRMNVSLWAANTRPDVHTSGHATRKELERMIELTQPRCFIPVHGTFHHLHNHERLAREMGVESTLVIENGQVAVLEAARLSRGGTVPTGRVCVDRAQRELSSELLRERVWLGRGGLLNLNLSLSERGDLLAPIQMQSWGVQTSDEVFSRLEREVEALVKERSRIWKARGRCPRREIERFVSFRLERELGQRPCVGVRLQRLPEGIAPRKLG